jgi:sucrose-6-phosphate hydrolase SacC (GH32 family)
MADIFFRHRRSHSHAKSVVQSLVALLAAFALCSAACCGEGRGEKLYQETWRPQFHFTPKIGWMNDPNGMLFYKGEYHLFYQCDPDRPNNPCGIKLWGHAVSPDMLHWTQLPTAIEPDALGSIWSGSGVVDWNNTSGFQTGTEKPLVCIYTTAGGEAPGSEGKPFTQSIAYSNDRGRTWTKYAKNPVLQHAAGGNRDPKVLWHGPSKQWIMALYLDQSDYGLFASPNLKQRRRLATVQMPGSGECPDFFPLPVDGNPNEQKWVFWAASNQYRLGRFDGKTFTPECEPLQSHWGKNRYAAQTFSDIPARDGRRIQIAWMSGGNYPNMPFNQQLSFPVTLALRTFPEGVRLCSWPVKEIDRLHDKHHHWTGTLKPGQNPLANVRGELFDVRLAIEPASASEIGLNVRGVPIQYDVKQQTLSCMGNTAAVKTTGGRLALQVLVDRTSIEIFAAEGRVNMAYCFLPPADNKKLAVYAKGGDADVRSLDVWELKSTWPLNPEP